MTRTTVVLAGLVALSMGVLHAGSGALESETTAPAAASEIKVEIKIGTGLENREVTGEADQFSDGTEQVVGWIRVTGAPEATQVNHVWKRNGTQVASVPLIIQSSPYRTYSRKTVTGMPGAWRLEVQDMNGAVLASKDFQVGAQQ